MKLFVLLPSYNEEKALPPLLDSIAQSVDDKYNDYEVVVVNDGSTDNTEKVVLSREHRLNIKLISHERNKGLGEAVNTGLSYFCKSSDIGDIAVIMDADNTHDPKVIDSMVEKIKKGYDVVIASRYEPGGDEIGLSHFRKLCSRGASILLGIFINIPNVKDYTCGYRAYSADAVKKAYKIFGDGFIEEKGFTCMAEIIIKLHYMGCEISEVPLVLRYDLKKGKSKMKIIRTINRYLALIGKERYYKRALTSEPVLLIEKRNK